nr:dehydrogenase/reductase SDR family member 7-like isoform X2 [Physcomitrium patens]|eukprot:XP_024367032.1 dehydrogenase/reductase SDR family member 7-like isoform X2 [Physcomitrella patens]
MFLRSQGHPPYNHCIELLVHFREFSMLFGALLVLLPLPLVLLALHFFFKADGDFTLTLKGPTPREAIADKVVWIIGASQNIGEELAKEYARLGAKLILTSRRVNELERVKAALKGQHAPEDVVVLPGDVSAGIEQLKELVEKAEAAFGGAGIDIVVQNAACPRPKLSAVDFPDDVLQRTFDVNVLGVIRITQLLLPGMLRRGKGQFVVVSSVAGKIPSPGQTVYCASKHALNGYFNSLRAEVLQRGVKVSVVCPGPINTPRHESETSEEFLEKRVTVQRCAELIVRSGGHDLMETWICLQPILFLLYVMQYLPALGFFVINLIGPKRVKSYNNPSGVLKMSSLFKKSS